LNTDRKGALVDLRPGPHEVVSIKQDSTLSPLRKRGDQTNRERAFWDVHNFAESDDGDPIAGNEGEPWPEAHAERTLFHNNT
ncbi:MAG: hypothetical protein ACOCV2_10150, partial [Persicimonas sp.]